MYVSSSAAVTDRSIRPPRLMSPRPTKSAGNTQPLPEDVLQHVDVLGRSDAAEEDDRAVRPDVLGDGAGADFERAPVLRVGGVDIDAGEVAERGDRHRSVDGPEPGVRRDDERRRPPEIGDAGSGGRANARL